MSNKKLISASVNNNDEFYTRLSDIEMELNNYKEYFKDKTIYCNCDNPYKSNFFRYFIIHFNEYKIKKLICSCYVGKRKKNITLFSMDNTADDNTIDERHKPYLVEVINVQNIQITADTSIDDIMTYIDSKPTLLKGDGDFRSDECVELLKEADIVITNPPFSLFREYLALIIEYNKQFLIIGSQNNVTYKEVFPLLKDTKIWLGYKSGDMAFAVPDSYEARETRFWIDEAGQKWRSLGNICWFTNLDIQKRHENLILYKKYTSEEYPTYDNCDAIEVSKVAEIPYDYDGIMGVPITFLDKFNPEQFEIIGLDRYTVPKQHLIGGRLAIDGKPRYARILIRKII